MIDREDLGALIGEVNTRTVENVFLTVPYATHLTGEEPDLETAYYLRHRVETIKRIQLTAKTDAMALVQLIDIDYDAARPWSEYVAEELDHDRLYMADLRRHGITDEQVAAIEPFPSTLEMLAYLRRQLEEVGPIAAVAYSVFTEWNSARGSAAVVAKAERQFSPQHVAGSKAHIGIDDDKDHYQVMVDIAHRLVVLKGDEQILVQLLQDIAGFFGSYFGELYESTIGARAVVVAG
jgi:hypothetical protein